MKKQFQITAQGKQDLEKELDELKGRRGEIADKIAEARDYGDLSENAEYDAAREDQGIVESRISEIEEILAHADIIAATGDDKVSLGNTVELKTGSKTVSYTVVGPVEANPMEGKISDESPIGKALFGKKVGDQVVVTTAKGEVTYDVVAIS